MATEMNNRRAPMLPTVGVCLLVVEMTGVLTVGLFLAISHWMAEA